MKKYCIVFALIWSFYFLGCQRVVPDPNDTTPPTITWTIQENGTGNPLINYQGNAFHSGQRGKGYTIIACGNDDGGLAEFTTQRDVEWHCTSGNVGQQVGPAHGVPNISTLTLNAQGEAFSEYCHAKSDTFNMPCANGFNFDAGIVRVNCTVRNRVGMQTIAAFTLALGPNTN